MIKSDKLKNKARDPYIVLSHVTDKQEILVQKLVEGRNRRNVLSVQLQNVYKPPPPRANSPSSLLSSQQLCDIPKNNTPSHDTSREEDTEPATSPTCFYCSNMGKPRHDHDDISCPYLQLVRPTPKPRTPFPVDYTSSEDEDLPQHILGNLLGRFCVLPVQHPPVDDILHEPPPLPARPQRQHKPPDRLGYNASPRQRKRNKSKANFSAKTRTPDGQSNIIEEGDSTSEGEECADKFRYNGH